MEELVTAMQKIAITDVAKFTAQHLEAPQQIAESSNVIPIYDEYHEGCIPLYTLRAACGYFEDGEVPEEEGWVDATGNGFTPDPKRHFVVHAKGDSMFPKIKNGDFCIFEYQDDDIDDVTLIDQNGDIIPRIEEVPEDRIVNMLTDEVLFNAGTGSLDNVVILKQDDETQQEYEDRVYQKALDAVNDEIVYIEENGKYNFQSYCGTPDVEWYDKARDWAVKDVMAWMTE
jgi:hypothetical protein